MRHKQLATAGVALTIMGILAGCETADGTSSATRHATASASATNTAAPNHQSSLTNTSKTGASGDRSPNIPQWFLKDVQMAEHANLSTGSNYILYYGSAPGFNVNKAMTHSWFGVYRGTGKPIDFGTNLQAVYKTLQNNPEQYGQLSNIGVRMK